MSRRAAPLTGHVDREHELLTTLLTCLHVSPMWPCQLPSSLPLLKFLRTVPFVNAPDSCCAVSAAAGPCGATGFEPQPCRVPTRRGIYLFAVVANILQVCSSSSAAAHRSCRGLSCACLLLLCCSLVHVLTACAHVHGS